SKDDPGPPEKAPEKPPEKPPAPGTAFDPNELENTLQWLEKVSTPFWEASGNAVAQERALNVILAEVDKLKGRELRWPLRVTLINKTGIRVEMPRYFDDHHYRVGVAFAGDRKRYDTNHIALADQDFLASLKPGEKVVVQ